MTPRRRSNRRRARYRPAALVIAALFAGACSRTKKPPKVDARVDASAKPMAVEAPPSRAPAATPKADGPVRFIAIGGGATPESTEISLEQDIELVADTLPAPGAILFAGGEGTLSIREVDPSPHGDAVLLALGGLFHPRVGRQSRYEAVRLAAGRASIENVEERLSKALAAGPGPLVVYIAAHGDQGEAARDNAVALWGGRPLTVSRFAELDERSERPLHLVVTSCFSGGFGELAFERADEHAGPSRAPRCGMFAGTWDRETSGCDANPDRRAQESYGLHFIHALRHEDRSGRLLPAADVDFDGDGKVGLLDAHTRARIAAMSLDVPTTTSERFLRSVEHGTAPIDRKLLPEDAAVVERLGAALGLPDEPALERRWKELDARMSRITDSLDDRQDELGAKEASLGSRLLERWPVLDDAFHPDFADTLKKHRREIAEVLEHSKEAAARTEAENRVEETDEELSKLEVEEARLLRLRRAYETLHRASALVKKGGATAAHYAQLLACEREAP